MVLAAARQRTSETTPASGIWQIMVPSACEAIGGSISDVALTKPAEANPFSLNFAAQRHLACDSTPGSSKRCFLYKRDQSVVTCRSGGVHRRAHPGLTIPFGRGRLLH
jgi:hypothetical protein